MKRRGTILLGLLLSSMAHAAVSDSPYAGIPVRNAFRLVEPKTQDPAPVVVPLPNVVLNGITTILGKKLALLTVHVPNQPLENCILAEGQKQGEVQVLSIDENANTVQLNIRGTVQTLDFKGNGARLAATPPAVTPVIQPIPRTIPVVR